MTTTDRDKQTSHSLRPFVKGAALPYRSEGGVLVTTAKASGDTFWGSPVRRGTFHLIEEIAIAWEPTGPVIGGRWLCGAGSIGVRIYNPVVFLDHWYADDPERLELETERMTCAKCRSVRDGEGGPCVYRIYDKGQKRLLYIGSTKNWHNRQSQHAANTWWWAVQKTITFEFFQTIDLARKAEAVAIRSEHPQFNVMHNRGGAA